MGLFDFFGAAGGGGGGGGGGADTLAFGDDFASSGNTRYMKALGFGSSSTEDNTTLPVSTAISLTTMTLHVPSNSLDGDLVVTLRKNKLDTGITITVPAGTTGFFRSTGSVSFDPGDPGVQDPDLISVEWDSTAAGSGNAVFKLSLT